MAMLDLYVYYQVEAAHANALAGRVRAIQAALGAGQIKRRPGDAGGRQTWMEVYTAVSPAFCKTLEAAIAAASLEELTFGGRHTEIFTELEPVEAIPCA
jgi:hypothetical protein